ncbi:Zinc finger and BTB domain-containing protein 16 [Chelonia mydas]|uniref:Zinc finger and BTB domain-containing protein 16 n=1 Tax=Chelonia mydas TaxID=8469 RepID=M7C3U2_CHEMY|nr:Zinc finger and BTB domain-containing protein 16 [Chelonia mydas]
MDLTKMGLIQLQNPSHPTGLLHKANQMRLAGTLCDVVIMVDNQEFHAHRTVLACTSKMFEILFHRNSQHYTLDFLSPKTFQQILEYAYTATLQAKVEDLDDLLYAAEILEIEYLEEQCLKILETIQASDENDTEVNMTDGGTEEEEDRKSRYIKNLFISKHSSEESSYASMASQSLTGAMVEQSPSVSTSFGLSAMSPTKAAVDSLMTIGQSLLQGALQQNASEDLHSTSSHHHSLSEVKTEVMQVEEASSHESPRTAESSTSGGDKSDDKSKEGPGTPTRSSVITSARELHYARDENAEQPLEVGQGVPVGPEHSISQSEKHLSIYSVLPNHKTDSMLSMPSSMTPALHMQPALAVSMDFSAYGGLLPQGFIQRELFSKLGELAAGMKTENRAISEQCSVCGAELPDNETVEQHSSNCSRPVPHFLWPESLERSLLLLTAEMIHTADGGPDGEAMGLDVEPFGDTQWSCHSGKL